MRKYDIGCNINTDMAKDFKERKLLIDKKKLVMKELRANNLMPFYNEVFYNKKDAEKNLKENFTNFKYKKYLKVDEFITL